MSRLTRALVERGFFRDSPITLLDIGVSGGLDPRWEILGNQLLAVGVDPDPTEITRLQNQETRPQVHYQNFWVGDPDFAARLPEDRATWRTNSFSHYRRSSAEWAERLMHHRYPVADREQGGTHQETTLDQLYKNTSWPHLDFIKIDTDGHDLEVLSSGPAALQKALAVRIEVQFLGQNHPMANHFANLDLRLRQHGLMLGDMEVFRYARAVLPDLFLGSTPGVTRRGGVAWGEALYFREPTQEMDDTTLTRLACILELHRLHDYATEAILLAGQAGGLTPEEATDLLAQGWWPALSSRRQLLQAFAHDPLAFTQSGAWAKERAPHRTRLRDKLRAWIKSRR